MWCFNHLYAVPPIDWWGGWTPLDEYLASVPDGLNMEDSTSTCVRYTAMVCRVMDEAVDYAGPDAVDIREGPYIAGFPQCNADYGDDVVLLAWKQDVNGTTFIASPSVLPHLHDDALEGYWKI